MTYIICHTERRVLLQHGPWDEVPGISLPTRVLDLYLYYSLIDYPPYNVMMCSTFRLDNNSGTEYYQKIKKLIVRHSQSR